MNSELLKDILVRERVEQEMFLREVLYLTWLKDNRHLSDVTQRQVKESYRTRKLSKLIEAVGHKLVIFLAED